EIHTVQQSTRLRDLQDIVSGTSQTTFPLVDNQNRLAGVISLSDMRHVMFEHGELSDLVVAGELGKRSVAVIHPGDSLADALEGLSGQSFEHLVVVDTNDERKVVGLLSHHAVMGRYRKALQQTGVFDRSEDESP
ncbi:MAG: CBS domain-containing protein, partial [Polyangiaceae bacterium]|nr:CBS domain-containing protein [Polyangiaceae bacterium]